MLYSKFLRLKSFNLSLLNSNLNYILTIGNMNNSNSLCYFQKYFKFIYIFYYPTLRYDLPNKIKILIDYVFTYFIKKTTA